MERPPLPIEIVIEITGKCRQVCPYCTGPRTPHVPWSDIKKTLDEAAGLGIRTVRITGGEPLISPDFRKVLSYAKSKKFTVILNTAAEDMTPSLLKAVAMNVDAALVSLQGYDERTNAAYTRSRNPFLDKVKNIFLLKAYLPTLWLATVITPTLGRSFQKFLPLVQKINPDCWSLFRAISETDEVKHMDRAFYRTLTLNIMKARRENINVSIGNAIPLCLTGNLKTGQQAFIGGEFDDGHVRLVRSAKGFFKPSYFLETNLGDTIQAAWANPFLRELDRTDYLPKECQRCPVLNTCRSGCRAMALRAYGTALAPDPLFAPAIAKKALSTPYPKHPLPQTIPGGFPG
ncbi:MAG: radical SAM protein [Candidatus Omnitrophota bacterium]|nr:radical SAM protein [Candidatus Omnitrophota bacterium]